VWAPPVSRFPARCDQQIAAIREYAVEDIEDGAAYRIRMLPAQLGALGSELLNVAGKIDDAREALRYSR
jgi:hypothetical protein